MAELNICIAGLGNVGSHLISTINESAEYINSKANFSINILGISAKNKLKKRNFDIDSYYWCDNPIDLLNIKNCNILVELIGEEKGISYEIIKKALESKINVVTANKALLAKNGKELFKLAEKNNVLLLFEAAVAGGIPIIKTLKNNIFLNKVKKISGILNGTTNFILTKMYEDNLSFNEVLEIAKARGYTTDNESKLDIGGLDSAHKLTLISTLCFGSEISFDNNIIEGIENITIDDINNANKLGYKIKLLSEVSIIDSKIYCTTSPTLISKKHPLSNVDGVLNGIVIETDQLKSLFLEGEGAGGKATASSVISDLHEIFSKSNHLSLGYSINKLNDFVKLDLIQIESKYYISILCKDNAGVLSKITSFFKDFDISVEKIIQLPENKYDNHSVPITITTHKILKNKLNKAISKISNQDFVVGKINIIPIKS